MSRIRLAIVVCVAATALLSAVPAHATFPGKNGKIAFARASPSTDGFGERDIWTVNPDGSGARQITTTPKWDILPDWSADASKIAFVSLREAGFQIWVMNSDSTGQRRLTEGGTSNYSPSWSPDGSQIAFTRYRSVGAELFSDLLVINSDGTGEHRIVGGNGEFAFEPSWSPDGSQIAYTDLNGPGGWGTIYTVRSDGTDRRAAIALPYRDLRAPDWSPDGGQIAFAAEHDYYNFDVWAANADGSNARALAQLADKPSWSPDGRQIAFSRYSYPPGQQEAWVMNADGSSQHAVAITKDSSYISRPDWGTAPRRGDYKSSNQFCRAEQTFWGDEFANRYGGGANAFGKCVSQNH